MGIVTIHPERDIYNVAEPMIWQLNRSGVFDVRSFYISLLAAPLVSFPWKSIWCVKVPKRVAFFLWTATRGGILTIDNLVKKNLPLVNWHFLCRCEEETMDHLLIHCKYAHTLWSEVLCLFVWVSMGDAEECCLSSLCMVELVGESHFKCVEYGSSVSYVVNLEGAQCSNF